MRVVDNADRAAPFSSTGMSILRTLDWNCVWSTCAILRELTQCLTSTYTCEHRLQLLNTLARHLGQTIDDTVVVEILTQDRGYTQ